MNNTGIALWRQIADELRGEIISGQLAVGGRLPAETALADRFSVNRHTVRAALAALRVEGIVHAERGRGTFVEPGFELPPRLANPVRISAQLTDEARNLRGELIASTVEPASEGIRNALQLSRDALVTRMETLSFADNGPVARSTSWFSAARFPAIDVAYANLGSIALTLRNYDIEGYYRYAASLSARHADDDEIARLNLAPSDIVMVCESIDATPDGLPVRCGVSRFAADRVELVMAEP